MLLANAQLEPGRHLFTLTLKQSPDINHTISKSLLHSTLSYLKLQHWFPLGSKNHVRARKKKADLDLIFLVKFCSEMRKKEVQHFNKGIFLCLNSSV